MRTSLIHNTRRDGGRPKLRDTNMAPLTLATRGRGSKAFLTNSQSTIQFDRPTSHHLLRPNTRAVNTITRNLLLLGVSSTGIQQFILRNLKLYHILHNVRNHLPLTNRLQKVHWSRTTYRNCFSGGGRRHHRRPHHHFTNGNIANREAFCSDK